MGRWRKITTIQVLLFACVTSCFGQVVTEYAGSSVSFEEDLKGRGFFALSGEQVTDENGRPIDRDMVLSSPRMNGKSGTRYWIGYVTIPNELSASQTYSLEHALEFDLLKHEKLLTTGDTNCVSRSSAGHLVIAVGKWQWKDDPRLGGDGKSIRLAWKADPQKKRLERIPERDVTCIIDSDRD